jgi:pimeloyl-ACP methyl ester carboxylesterase
MIKKFNIKDNTFIRYEVIGKGPPILLLHTIRNRLEYSYKVSDLLKKKYTLYLLELPGFGDSPININTKYDQEFFTNCVVDFIKENKLKNLIIAGESIGAVLSATTAVKLPKIVNKIYLFNPYDYDNYFGEGISRANLFAKFILFNISLPVVGSFFSSLENKIILKNILRGGFFDIKCLSNEYLNLLCSSIKKNGYTYHFRNVLKNYKSWTEAKKLYNKIKIPVSLVYGDNDWAKENNKNDTKGFFDLTSYNIIKDCGHFSFLEKPKEVSEILSS